MVAVSTRTPDAGRGAAAAAVAAIWGRYREDTLARVAVLEDVVAALVEGRLPEEARRAAEREAHRLAGATGTFGFPRASESARRVEHILAGTEPVPAERVLAAADDVATLRAVLEAGPTAASAPEPAPAHPGGPGKHVPLTAVAEQSRRERLAAAAHARVLVVDEDPVVLEAADAVLCSAGLRVVGLDDPTRFWTVLEDVRPHLVILDLDMPQPCGDEPPGALRDDPRWEGGPILFLTARGDPGAADAVPSAGAEDVLAKPFSGRELLDRVEDRLGAAFPHAVR